MELIAVLVMIGILALVAIPRFFDRQTFDARSFSDQVQSMLRYGQKIAIAQNRNVYVRLDGNSVALCFNPADCVGTPVLAPAGSNSGNAATVAACGNTTWFCEAVPTGLAYTALNNGSPSVSYVSANPSFFFSPLGKPYNTGDSVLVSGFTRPLTITITGGGAVQAFTVEPETGYVHN